MRESKIIIIISFLIIVIGVVSIFFMYQYNVNEVIINAIINVLCGIMVAFITAIIQFFNHRNIIKNRVYNTYLEIYKNYIIVKENKKLFHYNTFTLYRKIGELNPTIFDSLESYCGFFKRHDKLHNKLNPKISFNTKIEPLDGLKSLFGFNSKSFKKIVIPIFKEVENILKTVDKKKFDKVISEFKKTYELS